MPRNIRAPAAGECLQPDGKMDTGQTSSLRKLSCITWSCVKIDPYPIPGPWLTVAESAFRPSFQALVAVPWDVDWDSTNRLANYRNLTFPILEHNSTPICLDASSTSLPSSCSCPIVRRMGEFHFRKEHCPDATLADCCAHNNWTWGILGSSSISRGLIRPVSLLLPTGETFKSRHTQC